MGPRSFGLSCYKAGDISTRELSSKWVLGNDVLAYFNHTVLCKMNCLWQRTTNFQLWNQWHRCGHSSSGMRRPLSCGSGSMDICFEQDQPCPCMLWGPSYNFTSHCLFPLCTRMSYFWYSWHFVRHSADRNVWNVLPFVSNTGFSKLVYLNDVSFRFSHFICSDWGIDTWTWAPTAFQMMLCFFPWEFVICQVRTHPGILFHPIFLILCL